MATISAGGLASAVNAGHDEHLARDAAAVSGSTGLTVQAAPLASLHGIFAQWHGGASLFGDVVGDRWHPAIRVVQCPAARCPAD